MNPPRVPGPHASLAQWIEAIAAPTATAGGGTAAALAAGLAAAAVEMVAGLTLARPRYAAAHERAAAAARRARELREATLDLARRDAEAFARFERALALPRGSEAERAARDAARLAALREGAEVQLALLAQVAELADTAATLADIGLAGALGDAATAGFLAGAVARSAYWAVRANLGEARADPVARRYLEEAGLLLERVDAAEARVRSLAAERIR